MKFEEGLPALRTGKKIRRKGNSPDYYICLEDNVLKAFIPYFNRLTGEIKLMSRDLLADDWEVVEEKNKVRLRDLTTQEQLEKWKERNCEGSKCKDCVFNQNKVNCIYVAYCWIKDKSIFSDKFLDQEVEIEN